MVKNRTVVPEIIQKSESRQNPKSGVFSRRKSELRVHNVCNDRKRYVTSRKVYLTPPEK